MLQRLVLFVLVGVTVVASARPGAQARRAAANDPDLAELAGYRLTTGTLQKVTLAMQTFEQSLANDPNYKSFTSAQKELEALESKENRTEADDRRIEALERQLESVSHAMDGGDARTLGEMERAIAKMPYMPEALARAGLAPREYAKFSLTMLQAGMVAGMKKAGMMRDLPPGVSMENVQFMIDHEKEIAALTAMMQGR